MRRAAAGLAAIALLAGCGSSGMSDKQYRGRADAICAGIKAQRERLPSASNLEELKAVARSTIAINTAALRQFEALHPPGDLKAPHAVIVSRLQQTLSLQGQALKTDPNSQAMVAINVRAGQARAALLAAAQQAKLPACEQL